MIRKFFLIKIDSDATFNENDLRHCIERYFEPIENGEGTKIVVREVHI